MFAYRLVSGHWRVQTGVSRIGEEGTVTTAGVFGLNVLTGWDKRRPEWADVAWLAMRVHVGRQRKMGVADIIDVEEQDEPPTPSARKRKGRPQGDTEPPPPPPPKAPRTATPVERAQTAEPAAGRGQRGMVHEWLEWQRAVAWEARPPPRGHRAPPPPPPQEPRVRPPQRSGRCGRSRQSRWRGGGRGGWCRSGWTSSGRGHGRHTRSSRRPPTETPRPVCPGRTRTGGTPSRAWRTSPRSVTGWPPR